MPDNTPTPETENKKLAARVTALEACCKYLMEGAKRVEEEISAEWNESTYKPGEHFGVRIE